jgi:hypothetical protein
VTATANILESASPRPRSRAWIGRLGEFLVVGGITPFLFPLAWLLRRSVGLDDAQFAAGFLTFYGAHVINDPHFAVTYPLFYRDVRGRAFGGAFAPMQRIRYWIAGIIVPVGLAAWGLTAITHKSALQLGLMIQLMFLLVGWHYVKQGFGVMTVLSARRGVRYTTRERWAILAHCYAGWAYAWASPYDPSRQVEEKGVVYMTIAHPIGLERLTHVVFLFTIIPLAWVLVRKWRKEGRLPIFTPLIALLSSIWVWSIYSSIDPVVIYFIPALHSVQYLYFVRLMRGNEAKEREGPPLFEVSAKIRLGTLAITALGLGWLFFHGAPTYFDDLFVSKRAAFDSPLGPTPYFAAIYTFVNIHHFAMDAVIWRRDNPETRYLLAQDLNTN